MKGLHTEGRNPSLAQTKLSRPTPPPAPPSPPLNVTVKVKKPLEPASMESLIFCPVCGKNAPIVLEEHEAVFKGFSEVFFGIGKTKQYAGEGKCACGKKLVVSLHVTAGEGQ